MAVTVLRSIVLLRYVFSFHNTKWPFSRTRSGLYDVESNGNFSKIRQKAGLIVTAHAICNTNWWIKFRIRKFDIESNEKVMLNHKKFKIYFEVLCNCEKRLPRRTLELTSAPVTSRKLSKSFLGNLSSY